jgi:hypothetical protein
MQSRYEMWGKYEKKRENKIMRNEKKNGKD